jgi:3-oxoacyl-[acyl-carrier protein] reductase
MSLEGRVALVTGASRGIGQAIALELGQRKAVVAGTATSEAGAASITAFLKEAGVQGTGFVLELADKDSLEEAFTEVQNAFGAPAILINNAGMTRDNLLIRMQEMEWSTVIDVNLSGVYRLSKACLRGMMKARWGRIISITSVVANTGNAGQANYAAAKAGIVGFSKSVAREVASRGITINTVAPGFIETDMTRALPEDHRLGLLAQIPAGRLGQPGDVAAVVGFLASPEAGYITGETLHVNGGMYMA